MKILLYLLATYILELLMFIFKIYIMFTYFYFSIQE
jgi:hypothetical protein